MKLQPNYNQILTKEYLIDQYINKKLSPYDIAKIVGCNPHTIYSHLKKHNIEQEDRTKIIHSGDRFGYLTTIEVVDKYKNGALVWKYVHDDGTIYNVVTAALKNHSTNGKRHIKGCQHHLWKGYERISGDKWCQIQYSAKHRHLSFNISKQYVWDLFLQQDKICPLSGLLLSFQDKTASLDRINNDIGYEIGNVWWIHKDINKIKASLSVDKFVYYCGLIYKPLLIINNNFIPIDNIYKSFWKDIQWNAKKRNIRFDISKEDIIEQFNNQGGICDMTGLNLIFPQNSLHYRERKQTASLDRINNNKGYLKNNIHWVHKDINQSRKNLTIKYYKYLCTTIYLHSINNE
jgi:hypothetical protein